MTSISQQILDAKLALEQELARPLYVWGVRYIEAWGASQGHIGAHDRMLALSALEALLTRHYARVTMVMQGRRPPKTPTLELATRSRRHLDSLFNQIKTSASLVMASIDRELSRAMTATDPFEATDWVDDGTKSFEVKDEQGSVFGAAASYVGRIKDAVTATLQKWQTKLKTIVSQNTQAPAETARAEDLKIVPDDQRNGNIMKVWRSVMDGRERHAHHAAHGQEVPVESAFTVGGEQLRFPGDASMGASLGNIINCFPGDTRVSGDVLAASRHWYDGEIIEITTRLGHKLTGTPNHPVLTPEGWVALGALAEGRHVVSRSVRIGHEAPPVSARECLDVNDVEPTIEQVFDALDAVSGFVRVPRLAVDFHGDVPAHDVDIVSAKSALRVGVNTATVEHVDQFNLATPDLGQRLFFPRSLPRAFKIACGFGAASSVGVRRDGLALGLAGSRETEFVGGAATAGGDAFFAQAIDNRAAVDVERLCNGQNGLASIEKRAHVGPDRRSVSGPGQGILFALGSDNASASQPLFDPADRKPQCSADLFGGEAAFVEADRIVNVVRRYYFGHVFNLQTVHGLYHANGVVVHNCRCWSEYVFVGDDGKRTALHRGVSAPTRRYHRPGETKPPVIRPTSVVTLNGRTNARVILGDGATFATLRQASPNTVEVLINRRVVARGQIVNGRAVNVTVDSKLPKPLDIEGLIRRSVDASRTMDRRPYSSRP